MIAGAVATVALSTWPRPWWPRQTPSTGVWLKRRMSLQTPKSCQRAGCPGPGERTIASKSQRLSARQETMSLCTTIGSSPLAAASRWKTLYV